MQIVACLSKCDAPGRQTEIVRTSVTEQSEILAGAHPFSRIGRNLNDGPKALGVRSL